MRKTALGLVCALCLLLCGCGAMATAQVASLSSWHFQYNSQTDDFSLFFALLDDEGNDIAAPVDVAIRIVNDADETVFEGAASLGMEDFGYYTSEADGERYLAEAVIGADMIQPGKSDEGTVYFTVTGEDLAFDECTYDVLMGLPTLETIVKAGALPVEVGDQSYYGSSLFRVEKMEINSDDLLGVRLIITGEKLEGSADGIDCFDYRVLDSQGQQAKRGTVYLDSLRVGDRFRDDSVQLYDLIPGESYTVEFCDFG